MPKKSKTKTYFFSETVRISSRGIVARNEEEAREIYFDNWEKYIQISTEHFETDSHDFTLDEVIDESKTKWIK